MISPLFTTIVLCAGFIWIFMKVTSKNTDKSIEALLEKERLANSVRKQPLNSLNYIHINLDRFPVTTPYPSDYIGELFGIISDLSDKKIVNLTGISNTELKMTYGVANLNALSEYDQNFTLLCRTVYELGVAFYQINDIDSAIKILENGIEYGTDISGNYILLADLYISTGHSEKITSLISSIEKTNSLTRESTIKKLKSRINGGTLVNDNDGLVSSIPTEGDNILPKDILDILETVPYISDDQKQ